VSRKGWAIYHRYDDWKFARDVLHLLVHELKHIADFQNGYPDMNGCNPKYVASSEKRAKDCAKLVDKDSSEDIMNVLLPLSSWAYKDIERKLYPDPNFSLCTA
jgi:hypothetical protein